VPDEILITFEGERYFQTPHRNPECGLPQCDIRRIERWSIPVPAPSFGAATNKCWVGSRTRRCLATFTESPISGLGTNARACLWGR
jgi:hypothetical protein